MAETIATFDLSETMKIDDCQRLHEFLRSHTEQPVAIDCKGVSRLSGLAAQTLILGYQQWSAGDHPFVLQNTEGGFAQSLNDLGLAQAFDLEEAST